MSIFSAVAKLWAMQFGFDGGLSKPGPWRVAYPDGYRTRWLQYGECVTLRDLHGGMLEYKPEQETAK